MNPTDENKPNTPQSDNEYKVDEKKDSLFASAEKKTVQGIAQDIYNGKLKTKPLMESAFKKLHKVMGKYFEKKLPSKCSVKGLTDVPGSKWYKDHKDKKGWGMMYTRWSEGPEAVEKAPANISTISTGLLLLTCCDATLTTFPASDVRRAATAGIIVDYCENTANQDDLKAIAGMINESKKEKPQGMDDVKAFIYTNMKDLTKEAVKKVKAAIKGQTTMNGMLGKLAENNFAKQLTEVVLKKINNKFGTKIKCDGKGKIEQPKTAPTTN